MKRLALLALAVYPAFAQQAASPWPSDFVGICAGWNQYATPQINGCMTYGHLLSQSQVIYSFTTYDVTSVKTHPFTAQTSVRTGAAIHMRDVGPFHIFGLGDAGVAAAGTNVGGSFSGGGFATLQFGKTGLGGFVGARVLKTSLSDQQTVYELGVLYSWH